MHLCSKVKGFRLYLSDIVMDLPSGTQQPISSGSEPLAPTTTDEGSRAIGDDKNNDNGPPHQPSAYPAERHAAVAFSTHTATYIPDSASDASAIGEAGKGGDVEMLAGFVPRALVSHFSPEFNRLLVGAIRDGVAELRRNDEARISQ